MQLIECQLHEMTYLIISRSDQHKAHSQCQTFIEPIRNTEGEDTLQLIFPELRWVGDEPVWHFRP